MSFSKFIAAQSAFFAYIFFIVFVALLTQQTRFEMIGCFTIFSVSAALFAICWSYIMDSMDSHIVYVTTAKKYFA